MTEHIERPTKHNGETIVISATGVLIHPFNPAPEQMSIEDTARSLSKKCRFGGNMLPKFDYGIYTVAQHSCYVARAVKNPESQLWALVHDAPEFPFGDMISPIKNEFPDFEKAENRFAEVFRKAYNIPYNDEIAKDVQYADYEVFLREADMMMYTNHEAWPCRKPHGTLHDIDPNFRLWGPNEARIRFLDTFDELIGSNGKTAII